MFCPISRTKTQSLTLIFSWLTLFIPWQRCIPVISFLVTLVTALKSKKTIVIKFCEQKKKSYHTQLLIRMAYIKHIFYSCRVWNCMRILQLVKYRDVPLHNMHAAIHFFPSHYIHTSLNQPDQSPQRHHSPNSDIYLLVFPVTLPDFLCFSSYVHWI